LTCWLCYSFRLVILDVTGVLIPYLLLVGYRIYYFQNQYYLATENGLYVYNPLSGGIIENFNQWQKVTAGLSPNYACQAINTYANKLYVCITENAGNKGL
jgi:ligand-binding sensor domain-containing protein